MSTFEYLAVLFSVVVGLAITQTLQGVLRIVHHRRTVKVHWPVMIWTAAILLWAVFFWWFSALNLPRIQEWRLSFLLFTLGYASILYFLLGLLHPDDVGADFDMEAHFQEHRRWFLGLFLLLGIMDFADFVVKRAYGVSTLSGQSLVEYSIFWAVWILGALALLRVRSGRVLGVASVVFFVAALYITIRWGRVHGPILGAG